MNLVSRVRETIEDFQMLRPGEGLLIGLSGGADSVALMEILLRLRSQGLPVGPLRAVHVHHGLRPAADGDERFVRDLCARRNVPLKAVRVDAAEEAARRGMSVEEAGRVLRQEVFARESRTGDGPDGVSVALAHHRDDSAETLLFNLCRGASLAGLGGIRPVSEQELRMPEGEACRLRIIRPLILASREEIRAWLRENGLAWREDETNADPRYTRNYLRTVTLPGLEAQVNQAASAHMARTALELSGAEEYLKGVTEQTLARCQTAAPEQDSAAQVKEPVRENEDARPEVLPPLSAAELAALDPYLQKRVLYLALTRALGGAKDAAAAHVEALQALLAAPGSAAADLPGGVRARKEYDLLYFEGGAAAGETGRETDGGDGAGAARSGDQRWPLSPGEYTLRVLPYDGAAPPAGRYTKWVDYDKITQPVELRSRRSGDRIVIGPGDGGFQYKYKKLARAMIDRKIPARLRGRVILPMAGNEVIWFPGWRLSAACPVDADTKRVLEITWHGGERDGEDFGIDTAGNGGSPDP